MTALIALVKAHKKAVTGLISAEAATWLVALQGELTLRSALIATLTPLAVGETVRRTANAG